MLHCTQDMLLMFARLLLMPLLMVIELLLADIFKPPLPAFFVARICLRITYIFSYGLTYSAKRFL